MPRAAAAPRVSLTLSPINVGPVTRLRGSGRREYFDMERGAGGGAGARTLEQAFEQCVSGVARSCKTDSRSCSSNCAALVSAIKDPPSKSAPSSPRAPRTSILGQPEMAVCPSCKLDCAVSIGHDPVFWGTQAKVLHVAGVTGGLLSNLGGFLIRIRIPCIVHVSCMYRERILMCPVHIHQDTTGYNKIHLQIRTSLDTIEIHVSQL